MEREILPNNIREGLMPILYPIHVYVYTYTYKYIQSSGSCEPSAFLCLIHLHWVSVTGY